eukprot:scaffold649_cov347-Pavlova_lutheri.AAC.144
MPRLHYHWSDNFCGDRSVPWLSSSQLSSRYVSHRVCCMEAIPRVFHIDDPGSIPPPCRGFHPSRPILVRPYHQKPGKGKRTLENRSMKGTPSTRHPMTGRPENGGRYPTWQCPSSACTRDPPPSVHTKMHQPYRMVVLTAEEGGIHRPSRTIHPEEEDLLHPRSSPTGSCLEHGSKTVEAVTLHSVARPPFRPAVSVDSWRASIASGSSRHPPRDLVWGPLLRLNLPSMQSCTANPGFSGYSGAWNAEGV